MPVRILGSVILFLSLGLIRPVFAQSMLQGYTRTVSGAVLKYHSPHPDVKTSLLVRARHDVGEIIWETEAVPSDHDEETVRFVWMFGIDVNHQERKYFLFVDGIHAFTFSNPPDTSHRDWTVTGLLGGSLRFRSSLIDKYGDIMGYAVMEIPSEVVAKGRPIKIRVTSEDAGSNAWYMTFERSLEEKLAVVHQDLIVRGEKEPKQVVRFDLVHLGEPANAEIVVEDVACIQTHLKFGYNLIHLQLPEVKNERIYDARLKIGRQTEIHHKFAVKPVRKWTVYLVQHAHTDIGYTRPQTEILPEHLRFIDYALDLCDQTDDYPDDAKFRWTCEASWAVREYLRTRPETQIERLKRRIEEGRIEVTGLFFNYSEIIDEASLVAQLDPIRLFREHGIRVRTAMQNDVNGIGWGLVDYFSEIGVDYVIMGEHDHRALIPFDRPTVFIWESPSGKRVTAYRPDHYMTGNFFGVERGDRAHFQEELLNYLAELNTKQYPFESISIQYSGYYTDNSPPALVGSHMIREWNETVVWPRLRSAVAMEFMDAVLSSGSGRLPVYRKAWPDWWTDGVGSAARETAAVRSAHSDLLATKGLLAMARMQGTPIKESIQREVDAVQDALLFYDEHTYGAAESISDPLSENSMVQWAQKSAYAWEAVKREGLLREYAKGLLTPALSQSDVPVLVVFNTLNWARSGLLEVYLDHEILPQEKSFRLVDETGRLIGAQRMSSRPDGTMWGIWVEDIPAFGYRNYRLEVLEDPASNHAKSPFEGYLENIHYRCEFDTETGAMVSLVDKVLNRELVDSAASWGLNRFIYETLSTREELNRKALKETPDRQTLAGMSFGPVVEGPVWKSLTFIGQSTECADEKGVRCEIRLYHRDKRIEFRYAMTKKSVTTPEAVYVAFPFRWPGGHLVLEVQGGIMVPGKDQLEGSSSDWNTIQNFSAVRSDDGQIVFVSDETPLVQFGDLNLGKFQRSSNPSHPHMYSWVLNNYWVTNFKASQEGELKWGYMLTSSEDASNSFASRFGWGSRIPFRARLVPRGIQEKMKRLAPQSFLHIDAPNILLIGAHPSRDGEGIILHLRELDGKVALLNTDRIVPRGRNQTLTRVNALESTIHPVDGQFSIQPYEAVFIKIEDR